MIFTTHVNRSRRELHGLRGHPLVSGARAAGRRYAVRHSGGRLGDRLPVRRNDSGQRSVAGTKRRRSVVHDPADAGRPAAQAFNDV